MANDCGLLRQEDMPAFKQWLDLVGIGWNPGTGLWEVIRISSGGNNYVVTRNKQENYKSPETLRPLIQCFREYQMKEGHQAPADVEITDTERLEFMLKKSRRVVVEMCFSHHEIYVEECFMGGKKYSPVHIALPYEKWEKGDRLIYQRQAIDLAITESKVQTNEKSN